MALSEVTVTFNLHQALGGDFDARRTRAYVKYNVADQTLRDTSTGEIRLGDEKVTINDDGTGSFTTWAPGPDGNPASWQTYLVVEYPRTGQRDRQVKTFGPWTITASGTLALLDDEQAIPAEYQTAFTEQAQEYLDAQAAIAGIDDTDSAVGALLDSDLVGPLSRAAARGLVAGDIATPGSDIETALSASIDAATYPNIAREDPLLPARIGLANAPTSRFDLLVIGDSQTEGEGVTNIAQRWVQQLPRMLRARLGLPEGGRGYIGPGDTGQATYTYPATVAGGAGGEANKGVKSLGVVMSNATHGVDYDIHGTSVTFHDVHYGGGGTYDITVDGGAPVPISTDGAFAVTATPQSFGAEGDYDLTVRQSSGTIYHCGLVEYNGDETSGVMVHDAGRFGWTAHQWNTNIAASDGLVGQAWNLIGADLVVIALGHNEFANVSAQRTPAEFSTDLATLIATVRAALSPVPAILLVGYPAPTDPTPELPRTWQDYLDVMADLADGDPNAAFLDLSRRVPDRDDVSYIYADSVHGNSAWHGMVAQTIASYLVPSA